MANTGQQGYKILEGFYVDDSSLDGLIMPNIANISPDAIVPSTATITFNDTSSPLPTGGSNGDIWYNALTDVLYKKITGSWLILTNRVPNSYYIPPTLNTGACPIPTAAQAYLTSSITYGASNDFTITFFLKDAAGNPTSLTNNMVINFAITYNQPGGMTTGPLTVTMPLGISTYTPADIGSYDPSLGAPTGMLGVVSSVTPNPNGTSHVNF